MRRKRKKEKGKKFKVRTLSREKKGLTKKSRTKLSVNPSERKYERLKEKKNKGKLKNKKIKKIRKNLLKKATAIYKDACNKCMLGEKTSKL